MTHKLKKKITGILAVAVLICGLPFTAFAKTNSKSFSKGEIKDNKYVNEYFGYSIGAPKGYSFYDDKDLAEFNEVTEAFIKDADAVKKSIDAGEAVILAYAEGSDGYSNVNVGVSQGGAEIEKLDDKKEVYEEYVDAIKETLESMGFTVEKTGVKDEKIDGEKTYSLWSKSSIKGIDLYQKQTMFFTDDYIMTVTATTIGEDKTDDIFKEIKKLS
ncbi:hypothetical protein [Oribacterium sp. P6A1]|uniref:hypothetical protein n=1 Tax=Oribacterium sp. P6A1 TaxID=1410612 RepID=UPI00055EDF61|nr:hypothetical protein [Oribacterium sp. P6A1]